MKKVTRRNVDLLGGKKGQLADWLAGITVKSDNTGNR